MIRRPPRSTQSRSSAASDVYKRQHGGRVGVHAPEGVLPEVAREMLVARQMTHVEDDREVSELLAVTATAHQFGDALPPLRGSAEVLVFASHDATLAESKAVGRHVLVHAAGQFAVVA